MSFSTLLYYIRARESAHIGSPHHLVAQGVEEDVVVALYDLYGVGRLGDGEAGVLAARGTAPVDGYEEVVAAALYVERYLPVVTNHDGAHIEAVRSHGCKGDGAAVGHHDGASHAEGVGGGACRGGHDKAVGLVGGERGAVDGRVYGYHGGTVVLQHGYLVEGIGSVLQLRVVALQMQQAALLHLVVSAIYLVEGALYLVGRDVGQEPQSAGIDAQYGYVLAPHAAGGAEKGAVAPEADYHIGREVIAVEQLDIGQGEAEVGRKEAVKLPADAEACAATCQHIEECLGVRGFLGLVGISE